ncbi:MAG TPA: helicase-exonuclease AddAB subunit AddB [Virgibacillus sp.]|nr:helicase-exonuclease AddAB subunit AddB [Virgibacillus sp.]
MRLRFVFGRAGTGKSDFILEEIKQQLTKDPIGPPIFYIVPDQMTFQQEYKLFSDESIRGSIRAQVVSFSRLVWRVLQETGGGTRQFISSVGIQMMLRKIIEERTSDWNMFQKALEKQGFLSQLERMITEFKRYEITPEALQTYIEEMDRFVHKTPGEETLKGKLDDLLYIYQTIVQALQSKYIDNEDQLQMLIDKIDETDLLQDALIYFDGFHRFTPKELLVIEALMKNCRHVTVALTGEQPAGSVSELDLFYQTSETYRELCAIARKNHIKIDDHVILAQEQGRFKERPFFAHLEQNFDVQPSPSYEGKSLLQLAEAVHPRAEVEGVAQEIIRLIREENYRYKDMAIFIRETESYHDIIATIFDDYGIPVFIDEKKTMLNHPLIEFIRSALEVVESNWRYDAIFRVLKTGFIPSRNKRFPLTSDAIDQLENYVLEYGVRSRKQWTTEEKWIFQRFRGFDQTAQTDREKEMQQRINEYRQQVVQILQPFDTHMRQATTIRDYCEAIYLLLEEIDAPKQLEQWRTIYDEQGDIEKGREQEQVWDAVIQLFDEMVEIAGDDSISLATFRSTLDAGFESLKFAHVPPTIDHVIVGTIDHSRISGIRCAFLLGVNDGLWPMKPPADGIINEEEREILASHGLQLAESSTRKLLDDWFYMYLAFTAAKDYLWVSYPLSDEEGQAKTPSQLINRLQDLFPQSSTPILLQDPDDLVDAERFITTPVKTRAALTTQLARRQRGYIVKPIWLHVLNWYMNYESKFETTYMTLQSLFYQNKPSNLSEETAEKLYPKQVKTSVSRLEMYHRCSFQHFAQYSLGLEERRTYKLDAPDIGQLFHEALSKITKWIQKEGKDFAELTKKDTEIYARQAITELAPILQHQILHSSNRYKYIQLKLQEVIARATYVLSEQARLSDFSPVGIELGFGMGDSLDPLRISLPNGYELMLRGRIDRVDRAQKDNDLYLRIIDYKSSARGLSLLEVYYGLSLQMLAYLDVVLTQSEAWLGLKASPAGILYFHVHNAMISDQQRLSASQLNDELFKQYKMQGMLISDEQIVKLMDTSLESGTSDIIPAGVKKNGGFYSRSKVASSETFNALQEHIRQLMVKAGINMTSGVIDLNPFEHKQQNACTFCPFDAVCQFDPILEHNNFHKLKQMDENEILENIRKGVND